MPAKRTKAPARGKMPSKAQAALLRELDRGHMAAKRERGLWRTPLGYSVNKFTEATVDSSVIAGLVKYLDCRGLQIVLTPAGREILKQMEGK